MKNYFSYLILAIIIVSNNLFLLNEEFLILVSFISFCFIIYEMMSITIQNQFNERITNIESSITNSLNDTLENLTKKKELNKKTLVFKKVFYLLKNYYSLLSKTFLEKFLYYIDKKEQGKLLNKLLFFSRIEQDYGKFIFLLLSKKMSTLVSLLNFFDNNLKIKRFKTINKINRLSLINKI